MRDGGTEGMQHFDGEIDRLIRAGSSISETGLNLFNEFRKLRWKWPITFEERQHPNRLRQATGRADPDRTTEIEIER